MPSLALSGESVHTQRKAETLLFMPYVRLIHVLTVKKDIRFRQYYRSSRMSINSVRLHVKCSNASSYTSTPPETAVPT